METKNTEMLTKIVNVNSKLPFEKEKECVLLEPHSQVEGLKKKKNFPFYFL